MIEKLIQDNIDNNLGDVLFENALSEDNDNKDNISLIVLEIGE